jgi:hypothetical protein
MPLITREEKGEKLTISEMDNNLIYLDNKVPYKVYTALLTQTGTSAPVATVLENTIGAISFIYDGVGLYRITESLSFDVNRTALFLGPVKGGYLRNALYGPGYWGVSTCDNSNLPADGAPGNLILSNTPIEIRVYN